MAAIDTSDQLVMSRALYCDSHQRWPTGAVKYRTTCRKFIRPVQSMA